jgi:hypothetical protein
MDFDPRDSDSRDESRWPDRDREPPDRALDSREPFTRDLDLPRGLEREVVRDRDREYTLRGSETRTLATVGAFRVVSSRDLRDQHNRPLDPRSDEAALEPVSPLIAEALRSGRAHVESTVLAQTYGVLRGP